MKITVTREVVCAADDQAGPPTSISVNVHDSMTAEEFVADLARLNFLQFSSSHSCVFGFSGSLPLFRVCSPFHAPGAENAFYVPPIGPLRDFVKDGRVDFQFVFPQPPAHNNSPSQMAEAIQRLAAFRLESMAHSSTSSPKARPAPDTGRRRSIPAIVYFVCIGGLAATLFFRSGVSTSTVVATAIAAALLGIPLYFETRNRSLPPSIAERVFASAWVWFRRVTCVGFGLVLLLAALPHIQSEFAMSALLSALGAFSIYVGIFGQGPNRARFDDDISLHRENKRRYKWWF